MRKDKKKNRDAILNFIEKTPGCTRAMIMYDVPVCYMTVHRYVNELIDTGAVAVHRVPNYASGTGSIDHYFVPPKEESNA